jgi:P4 family phage/plasmid primase-like protien
MQTVDSCISENGGDNQLYKAACRLVIDWGLSPVQALPYLREYNQRCEPPWQESRLLYKLSEADKRTEVRGQLRDQVPSRSASSNGNSHPPHAARATTHSEGAPQPDLESDLNSERSSSFLQLVAVDQISALPEETDDIHSPALNEHATETELARIVQSKLPPLRCVGEDWYVYRDGAWCKTTRNEFKPLSLSIQDPKTRTARKALEVLKHIEFANQTTEKEFKSFHLEDGHGNVLINCANCVIAVSATQIRELPHSEHYFFTRKLAADYRTESACSSFEAALEAALPDGNDIELMRCFCGYILLPDCRHEVALVCYGDGETGKSTISAGIQAALGPGLVTECSLTQISDPQNKNLAKLAFAALNLSTELDAVEVGSENFKRLVSGEGIDADRKFRDSISLRASCKLWFNANHLPRFKSGTDAELRRLYFIGFRQKIKKRDVTLKERVKAEADGILLFMLDGLKALLSKGHFPEPGILSLQTKDRFKLQNDPIRAFIETDCVLGKACEIVKAQLYDAYSKFCEAHGIPPYNQAPFFREVYARHPAVTPFRGSDGDARSQKVKGIDIRE